MATPEHIIQPVEHDPDALVTNVYRTPGTLSLPDYESQDVMGEYLAERMRDPEPPRTRIIFTETSKTTTGIERRTVGWKEKSRYERDGWVFGISPKIAMSVWAGSALLSIANPGLLDIADEAKVAAHDVRRYFDPLDNYEIRSKVSVPTPGPDRRIRVEADAENLPGSALVDSDAIDRFAGKIARVIKKGGKVQEITIVGRSSDDYGTNESIGRAEPPEQDFADDRARAYAEAVKSITIPSSGLPTKVLNAPTVKVDQDVLSQKEKATIAEAATQAGFTGPDNIIDAINNVEAGTKTSTLLNKLVRKLFTDKRGVVLDAAVNMPGKEIITTKRNVEVVTEKDNAPDDPNRDYNPWFIPVPFFPRLRRIADGFKPIRRLRLVHGKPIMTPSLLKEEKEEAWVRVRPEAVREDGSLSENPWAYTRKFEQLLRDNRIVDLLRADFPTKDGDTKSLRIMFIDKSPAEETITAFEDLLKKFAAMQDGALADRISGIFVYPSDNAGRSHQDPKRIALGVDRQSHEGILGTYTYVLDMVELHMPTTWDAEELHDLFTDYLGPTWTLAHEAGGHGTDDNDAQLKLRRIHTRGIPNAHTIVGDARAHRIRPLQHILQRLPRHPSAKNAPIVFDISYPVLDNNGRMVTTRARVSEDDPRLAHATESTIVGYEPTLYSGESDTEHYAETAAAVTTGINIPYSQAFVDVPGLTTDDGERASFASGYHPDIRGQNLFTAAVGAQDNSYPVTFVSSPEVTISHIAPANDRMLREELQRTRSIRTLRPTEMVAILARVTQRNRKPRP